MPSEGSKGPQGWGGPPSPVRPLGHTQEVAGGVWGGYAALAALAARTWAMLVFRLGVRVFTVGCSGQATTFSKTLP